MLYVSYDPVARKTYAIAISIRPRFLTVLHSTLARRYDHPDTRCRRGIIHHPQSVGAGRVDIRDIAARRKEDRRDRDIIRERAHDYLDQCAACVREARSCEQQGVRSTFHLARNTPNFFTHLVHNFLRGLHQVRISRSCQTNQDSQLGSLDILFNTFACQ